MKKLLLLVVAATTLSLAQAQPPKGPANPGDVFRRPDNRQRRCRYLQTACQIGKEGQYWPNKGNRQSTGRMPQKGCWMKVQVNDSTTAFVKMKDYGFFVPMDMIGKTVVLDTEAKLKTTSVDELKHYAEDAKKPQAEIDAITQPKKEIRLSANGILVMK